MTERGEFEKWAITNKLAYRDSQIGVCFYSASDGYPSWRAWQARAAVEPAAESMDFQSWWDRGEHAFFVKEEARLVWNSDLGEIMDRVEFLESELARILEDEPAAPVVEQEPVGYMSPEDVEYLRDSIVQYRGRNYNIKSTIFLDSGLSATVPLYTHPAEIRGETGGSDE